MLHHLRTVRIPFTTNQNLSDLRANTIGCVGRYWVSCVRLRFAENLLTIHLVRTVPKPFGLHSCSILNVLFHFRASCAKLGLCDLELQLLGCLHATQPLCYSDLVQQRHSFLSTSNVSKRHRTHESNSTQFGLRVILESGVQLAGKLPESRRSRNSSIAGCVFYVEIWRKLLGMNVTKIFRYFFGNLR